MNTANFVTIEEKNNTGLSAGLNSEPTLVVGLGKTGLSCIRFLVTNDIPAAVTDSRNNPPCLDEFLSSFDSSKKQVPCSVGGFDHSLFEWAKHIVVSPGVSVSEPEIKSACERGVEVLGDVELFARCAKAPVVAITGSNGKSTVTMLVHEMAKSAGNNTLVGGNIGTPVLDLLLEPVPDFYILELSSFQLETTQSLDAAVSVVLNISSDHMDRYRSLEHYASSKQRIYGIGNGVTNGLQKDGGGHGVMIVNRDDATVMAMQEKGRGYVSFGLDNPAANHYGCIDHQGECWLARGNKRLLPASELRIAGKHNLANALAALALGEVMGLPVISMLDALRKFSGLPHRTQWVADIDGVTWYNDSKGTNVGATLSAIQGFSRPVLLIAGGQGKGADFGPLREVVKSRAREVILLGEDAPLIENAIAGVVPVTRVMDMGSAVTKAHSLAHPGDVVLLSPACASFDMFAGFEERGNSFINSVRALQAGGAS